MRIVVLGAGVIGVTTAYELARDGHDVTVVDRLQESAEETSFANAGLIAPGHAYAWSSPRAPGILLRSLVDKKQALRFRPRFDPMLWSWSLKFLMNCTVAKARGNTKRKVRLCLYSQGELQRITAETGIKYHSVRRGLLYLYRKPESFERGIANTRILAEEGLELRPVSGEELVSLEPALRPVQSKFAGAVYCPTDESGDARVFTQELARHCQTLGVKFEYNTNILGFENDGDTVRAARSATAAYPADAFVLCLGVFSPLFARQLKVSLPIYPVKGYSVTLPIGASNTAPTIGGVDEDNLVAFARFGDRLRATGTAEFAGYDKSFAEADLSHLVDTIRDVFPNGANYKNATHWAGLRPMTPEGTPIFGRGFYRNVVFNTGHGHMGWTMSAGSARIAADLVAAKKPKIDLDGMRVSQR